MTAIATLRFAQSREIDLKIFLEGCRSSWLFRSPDHNSSEFYLIIHSDQTTQLSKAWAVTFLIFPAFLPMKVAPRKTHFSAANFIKWRILSQIMCHSLTKGRSSSRRSGLLHYHSPDLNPEQRSISAQLIFSLLTLFSWFRTEKLLLHTSSLITFDYIQEENCWLLAQMPQSEVSTSPPLSTAHLAPQKKTPCQLDAKHFKHCNIVNAPRRI
jgi:hypothetical protein